GVAPSGALGLEEGLELGALALAELLLLGALLADGLPVRVRLAELLLGLAAADRLLADLLGRLALRPLVGVEDRARRDPDHLGDGREADVVRVLQHVDRGVAVLAELVGELFGVLAPLLQLLELRE